MRALVWTGYAAWMSGGSGARLDAEEQGEQVAEAQHGCPHHAEHDAPRHHPVRTLGLLGELRRPACMHAQALFTRRPRIRISPAGARSSATH